VDRKRWIIAGVVLLALASVVRVVLTYHDTAQAFDEPAHISAGLEWIQFGTYELDPLHPPLSRIAIGLPLYLSGARLPSLTNRPEFWTVGNGILNEGGHYLRNLALARCGVLHFLLLAMVLVFLWTRRNFGDFAALAAVFLFSTLPTVLAFSGLAYTDLPAACMQFAAIFSFANWTENPSRKNSTWLGVAFGLAVLTKFTTLLFIPAASFAMLACKWLSERAGEKPSGVSGRNPLADLVIAALIALLIIWGGYRFSVRRIQQSMQLSPQTMPSFEHFPSPVRGVLRKAILSNSLVPAPALLQGLAEAWVLNKSAPPAYLLGKTKGGGWWYFFFVAAGVKLPLPFLILASFGLIASVQLALRRQWKPILPAVAALAILATTTRVDCYYGVRHVLVVFPLLAIVAAAGAAWLWWFEGRTRVLTRTVLAGLLFCQCVSSLNARSDYLAYFNELAGHDPSQVLVAGCDLDCGQDLLRLSQWLRQRNVSHVSLAVWSSADLACMELPEFGILQPLQPVAGWVAVSVRAARMGDVLHKTYPPGALAWLDRYQPVAQVGKTIQIYYIKDQ